MSDIAIRVENPCAERSRSMSKLYHIGALRQREDTLRDALTDMFRRGQNDDEHTDQRWFGRQYRSWYNPFSGRTSICVDPTSEVKQYKGTSSCLSLLSSKQTMMAIWHQCQVCKGRLLRAILLKKLSLTASMWSN